MDGRLVLACPYDPAARFQVGQAMQRNKLIYALSDAALVVNSDYGKGGTWTGATEQLDKLKLVPVYVRANGVMGRGLEALRERGAAPWPAPETPEALERILDASPEVECGGTPGGAGDPGPEPDGAPEQRTLSMDVREESAPSGDDRPAEAAVPTSTPEPCAVGDSTLAGELFAKVGELIECMDGPRTEAGVAEALQVPKKLAEAWLVRFTEGKIRELFEGANLCKTEAEVAETLQISGKPVRICLRRLVEGGVLDKLFRPVRYRSNDPIGPLFNQ